jgi:hypothetical protein
MIEKYYAVHIKTLLAAAINIVRWKKIGWKTSELRGMRSPQGDGKILNPHPDPQRQMAFFGFPVPFLD